MTLPNVWTDHIADLLHNFQETSAASLDPFHSLLVLEWWSMVDLDEKLDSTSSEFVQVGCDKHDLQYFSKLMHTASNTIFRALLNRACRDAHLVTDAEKQTATLDLAGSEGEDNHEQEDGGHHCSRAKSSPPQPSATAMRMSPSKSNEAGPDSCDDDERKSANSDHQAVAPDTTSTSKIVKISLASCSKTPTPRKTTTLKIKKSRPAPSRQHLKSGLWGCYLCDKTFAHRDSVYNHFQLKHKPEGKVWDYSLRKDLQRTAE